MKTATELLARAEQAVTRHQMEEATANFAAATEHILHHALYRDHDDMRRALWRHADYLYEQAELYKTHMLLHQIEHCFQPHRDIITADFYFTLGRVQEDRDYLRDSIEHYQTALRLLHSLYEPPSFAIREKLLVTYGRLANVYHRLLCYQEAEALLHEARTLATEAFAAEENEENARQIAQVYRDLAYLLLSFDKERGEKTVEALFAFLEQLATQAPGLYLSLLLRTYERMRGVYLMSHTDGAEQILYRSRDFLGPMAEKSPTDYAAPLADVLLRLADQRLMCGRCKKALEHAKEALDIYLALSRLSPRATAGVVQCYLKLSQIYNRLRDPAAEEKCLREAEECGRRIPADPDDEGIMALVSLYDRRARAALECENYEDAECYFLSAVSVLELPETSSTEQLCTLGSYYLELGLLQREAGDVTKAESYLARAMELLEGIGEQIYAHEWAVVSLAESYCLYGELTAQPSYIEKSYKIAKNYPEYESCEQIVALAKKYGF